HDDQHGGGRGGRERQRDRDLLPDEPPAGSGQRDDEAGLGGQGGDGHRCGEAGRPPASGRLVVGGPEPGRRPDDAGEDLRRDQVGRHATRSAVERASTNRLARWKPSAAKVGMPSALMAWKPRITWPPGELRSYSKS